MDVNQAIGEQSQVVNQTITATALQRSHSKSLGQGYGLHSWMHESTGEGAGLIVICAKCLTFTYQGSLWLKPRTPDPHDASTSQEVKQTDFSASTITKLQNLNKCHFEVDGLKSLVAESLHDEEFFPATACAGSVSCHCQRSILPNTLTEPVEASVSFELNQAVPSALESTRVQQNLFNNCGQIDMLNSWVPEFLHDKAVVPCASCVTCNFKSNIAPKPFTTEPCSAGALTSSNYAFWPSQQDAVMAMPQVNLMAEVENGSVPFAYRSFVQPAQLDGSCLPHHEAAACDLNWNELSSTVSTERCNLMEQQSTGQCRSLLGEKASPLDLKGAYASWLLSTKADHMASPTLCRQFNDENDPSVINVPKCISIRADNYTRQLKVPKGHETDVIVASNAAASTLLPIDNNKPYRLRHRAALTMNEVEEQTKVVALAENLACLAFPQGMYKTEMCNKWMGSMGQYCPYGNNCHFAHGSHELRPVLRPPRYKTVLCRMVAAGKACRYEHRCHFRHALYPHEAEVIALNPVVNSASSLSK